MTSEAEHDSQTRSAIERHPGAEFDARVMRPLRRLAARARLLAVAEGLSLTLALLVLLAAAQGALDWLLHLETGPRAVLLVAVAALSAYGVTVRVIRPMRHEPTAASMAAVLERRNPTLSDALISAVQFAERAPSDDSFRINSDSASGWSSTLHSAPSPGLLRALWERAASTLGEAATPAARARSFGTPTHDVRGVPPLFNRARIVRAALVGATSVIFLLALVRTNPQGLAVYFSRNILLSNTPWPSHTNILPVGFRNGSLRWPRGDPLTLVVNVSGDPPRRGLRMEYETTTGAGGERPLSAFGERQYRLEFGTLEQSIKVWFVVGRLGVDARSAPYIIEAVDRPSIVRMEVTVQPPVYTRLPAYRLPPGQLHAEVLNGSTLTLTAELNKAGVKAELTFGGRPVAAAEALSPQRCTAQMTPESAGSLGFDLRDQEGLTDARPVRCSVRLVRDRPPRVRLTLPGAGDLITSGAVLPISAEIEDNHGLASAEFVSVIERSPSASTTTRPTATAASADEASLRFDGFEPYQKRLNVRRDWPVSDLGLSPGDRLAVFCRATDFQPVSPAADGSASGPENEGRSSTYAMRVVSAEELLLELARRETEARQEFEQILNEQERIHVAVKTARLDPSAATDGTRRGLERRQRAATVRVRTVRGQFQAIFAEFEINRLAGPPVQKRLRGGVIEPLGALLDGDLAEASRLLVQQSAELHEEQAKRLERTQERIVREMRRILAQMLKWEGYNEAVNLLRDLLKLQADVRRETQAEMERRIEELFGAPTTRPTREGTP